MFAHQVLDWLNNNIDEFPDVKIQRALISAMKVSQKFHGGAYRPYWEIPKFPDPVFRGVNSNCKLPFSICWFDFIVGEDNISKYGALCIHDPDDDLDKFRVILFQGLRNGGWSVFPRFIIVYPDMAMWEDSAWETPSKMEYVFKDANSSFRAISTPLHTLNGLLLFLSCRNVTTKEVPAPDKLNSKRKRKGNLPIFSYRILVIKSTGKKQESIPKHLWNNRIHLARGHFKTYTKENPLFGKIVGRYWWQPHVRGRNIDGVVMKDYEIDPL